MQQSDRAPPEVWGGIECSHVLIRGELRDQGAEGGHDAREDDIERIAELGIRVLRYPLLWAKGDLDWHAPRIERLRALGIAPIVGFVHHGSGPGGLAPDDPAFAHRLGDFAEAVASRFPWITRFTPLNEPVTSARFGFLYGHWHPHARSRTRFLRAIVGSAVATADAMARIRRHTPGAELVQTEDLGRAFSVPRLAGQADYENERRFLCFDLLAGRVDAGHRFHAELIAAGVEPAVLERLVAAPCPPDVIGVNHYLTSDRFLDTRLRRYPGERVGGNGRQRYVDVAAARVPELGPETGPLARLREVHARYGRPVALAEVHNGCTREEQLRWLAECWAAANAARAEGVDVRALTVWSLFGSIDWNTLLTERRGHYESGAFDTRSGAPRPTAIARAVAALIRDGEFRHPVLAGMGWWHAGETPPGPCLRLLGVEAGVRAVEACAARRRLPVCHDAPPWPGVWGTLVAHERGYRFTAADGPVLQIELPPGADREAAANAVLDLAIDGASGLFRLSAIGPHNQYLAEAVEEAAPPPRRARAARP